MANQEEQMNEDYLFKTKIRIRIRIDNTNFNKWVKWLIIGLYVVQILLALSYAYVGKPLEYWTLVIASIYFAVLSLGYITTNSHQLKEKHLLQHQSLQSLLLVVLSIHQALYFLITSSGSSLNHNQLNPLILINFFTILLFWISAYIVFKTVYKYTLRDLKDILTLNQIAIALLLYGVWVSIMSLKENIMILVPILIIVVLLLVASWVKWIKKPTSGISASDQVRSQALNSIVTRIRGSSIVKVAKDLVALSSLVVGVFTLALFIYAFGAEDSHLTDLFALLATSAAFFYIFTKLMISYNKDSGMFVYDNHFREENKWEVDIRLYKKYVSRRFRRVWMLNLIFVFMFFISLNIYLDYERQEYHYQEQDFWSLFTLGIVILAVVSWVLRYIRKYRYQEKMDQLLGGLNLSGGSLAFILEQTPELKAFASIELLKLINKGILERISVRKEGE
ncbi:MAG: hypothetical protein KAR35_03295 [Candidatus Heimdallarchaeota archaeon]|nr:hypothetical protein [Candidatus Heimdallarchaeota archaeon]MCK5048380.1 hypothetical protein [Candidatus Heimdallarchaeota archaeon]